MSGSSKSTAAPSGKARIKMPRRKRPLQPQLFPQELGEGARPRDGGQVQPGAHRAPRGSREIRPWRGREGQGDGQCRPALPSTAWGHQAGQNWSSWARHQQAGQEQEHPELEQGPGKVGAAPPTQWEMGLLRGSLLLPGLSGHFFSQIFSPTNPGPG